jgi:hypothetical protein
MYIPTVQEGDWAYDPECGRQGGDAALSFNGIEFVADDDAITPAFIRRIASDLIKLANGLSAAGVR